MAIVRTGYANFASFPPTGAIDIIYVDLSNGDEYTWVTSAYVAYTPVKAYVSLGYKDAAWFAANPGLLLAPGQPVLLEQTGLYKVGTGVTELQNLSFLGNMTTIQDGLTSGGEISVVGDDITVAPAGWLISPNVYGTLVNTDFLNITLSSAGNQRYIGFYGTTSNTIVKVEGTEDPIAEYPLQPPNTIVIGFVLVGDAVINTQPDVTGFEEKINKVNTVVGNETDANKYASVPALVAYLQANYAFSLPAFFSAVRGTVLTGLSLASSLRITASDSIIGALGKIQSQINKLLGSDVFSYTLQTTSGDTTKFDFTVTGEIRNPITGVITDVNVSFLGTPVVIYSTKVTYIGVKEDLSLTQQQTRFTTEQRYNHLCEWVVIYNDGVNINAYNRYPNTIKQIGQQLHNMMANRGVINLHSSLQYFDSPTTALAIRHTAGKFEGVGWGDLDADNPNEKTFQASISDISNIEIRTRNSVYLSGQTLVTPGVYDLAGVVTSIPNNKWSVQRINNFNSDLCRIQLGQDYYDSKDEAIAKIASSPFVIEQNISDNGLCCTFLVIREDCADWTNPDLFQFVEADEIGSKPSGGTVINTLQASYGVSSLPQFLIDAIRNAIQVQNSRSGSDSSTVIEIKNFAGTTTFSVNGNGTINSQSITASQVLESDASKNIISAAKNSAYNKNFGSSSGTVTEGNDSRLSDSRYRKIVAYQNTDSTTTGSTNETVLANLAVTGGEMGANGSMTVVNNLIRSGTAGITTYRIYVSTVGTNSIGNTGTPTSSTLMGTFALGTTVLYGGRFMRTLINKNSQSVNNSFPATATVNINDSVTSTAARTAININTANNFWVVITTQLANSGDTCGLGEVQIEISKP